MWQSFLDWDIITNCAGVPCESYFDYHCYAAAAAKSLQLCPILCEPIDGSPPGSPVPGILQARTLEQVAISFSNAWKWKVKVKLPSCVWLLATSWTAAHQAPPFMGFSRQEYWSGLPLPFLATVSFELLLLFSLGITIVLWLYQKFLFLGDIHWNIMNCRVMLTATYF